MTNYTKTVLASELDNVRSAGIGTRNGTLNTAAFTLGQLCAIGEIDRNTIETELTRAAVIAGLSGREIATTLKSGMESGLQQPYDIKKQHGRAYSWDEEVEIHGPAQIIDPGFVEDLPVEEPDHWDPTRELIQYLDTLFEGHEFVSYVVDAAKRDDKWLPSSKGVYTRTAGELIQALTNSDGDIKNVIGDYKEEAGVWIRPNPMDGKGVDNINVAAYRYALVEADDISVERQAALYKELRLPIATLVHSGKKSLHAIVRIGATTQQEYRERVNYLFETCKSNGLPLDEQNKNPSRLSRMPGVTRSGQKQYLVGLNEGKESWDAWKDYIEELDDSLPDIENLADVFGNLPPLAPILIDGILRNGHKMLLAGPSKAGKSFMLLQLAIAIAEGNKWLGRKCQQGRVLYINLELDRASALHRTQFLYEKQNISNPNLKDIDFWHLRGKAQAMNILTPRLIRRARDKEYTAIILDPIYKVITGSENEASEMASFCNQFDAICTELSAAFIYCHHHSKGSQGQKASMDRASGSGVFARDPDAMLDLIEVEITSEIRKTLLNQETCRAAAEFMDKNAKDWRSLIGQDDALSSVKIMEQAIGSILPASLHNEFLTAVQIATEAANTWTGWRIEPTLREFVTFKPVSVWFQYPLHKIDEDGILADAKAEGEDGPNSSSQRSQAAKRSKKRADDHKAAIEKAWETLGEDQPAPLGEIADLLGTNIKTVTGWARKHFTVDKKIVYTKQQWREKGTHDAFKKCEGVDGTASLIDLATELGLSTKRLDSSSGVTKRFCEIGYVHENGAIRKANEDAS